MSEFYCFQSKCIPNIPVQLLHTPGRWHLGEGINFIISDARACHSDVVATSEDPKYEDDSRIGNWAKSFKRRIRRRARSQQVVMQLGTSS